MKFQLPSLPFTTRSFQMRQARQLDLLGLAAVNLDMLASHLIPEINNQTADMGSFALAGWIVWRFHQITDPQTYTENTYKEFREKVEVAITLASTQVHRRIGAFQQCALPQPLSFSNAGRNSTSIFSAPNYGPSLLYLGFISGAKTEARAAGKPLEIPVPATDEDSLRIVEEVDRCLRQSRHYHQLADMGSPVFTQEMIDDLARCGLDPAEYRNNTTVKEAFRRMLLPNEGRKVGFARSRTHQLIIATLTQHPQLQQEDMRGVWYTRLLPNGQAFDLEDPDLNGHLELWSCFLGRQYQRHILESFLWVFEAAVKQGCRSIPAMVDFWAGRSAADFSQTFAEFAQHVGAESGCASDDETSLYWRNTVHGEHPLFEYSPSLKGTHACLQSLRHLAGWRFRHINVERSDQANRLFRLGGNERISMDSLLKWLSARMSTPVGQLLAEIFRDLIASQHIRTALSRADGVKNRLRFTYDEVGVEMADDFAEYTPFLMQDRLAAFMHLLDDCGALSVLTAPTSSLP